MTTHRVPLFDGDRCIGRVSYTDNLDYWDGRNHTCGSTGHHLGVGKLRDGRFYLCHGTNWQGERDRAEVVSEEVAKEAVMRVGFERLYRDLFDEDLPDMD